MLTQQEIQVTSYRVQVQNKKAPRKKKHFQEEFGHCLGSQTDICN